MIQKIQSIVEEEKKAKVLVVDDDEGIVKMLEDFLSFAGYSVRKAKDGYEALLRVSEEPPDIILLDVMMPRMTGYEVCLKLKGDNQTRLIPIIILTAMHDIHSKVKGIECGADDFISKPFNTVELKAKIKSLVKLKQYTDELENVETVLFSLAISIESKDPCLIGHCERLSRYSMKLGRLIGLPGEQIKALERGGILHDIGKVGIPDSILLKPSRLSDEEFEVMKEHTIIGEKIIKPMKTLGLVLPIIRYHHEKWDGSGYPDGLKGEEIPITARILQTVDIYDALTTNRAYKPALLEDEVFRIMRQEVKRGWWDSKIVELFIEMIQKEKE